MMTSNEIREKFLKFFEDRGHKILPSSSLVPEGDISVLFTTAGMQQFKGYYSASENAIRDFGTKNVTTVQKCVRTGDIDEVGDNTHLSFFEMLGNFSFGGYGRREAITYAHEFITKEIGLDISYVTYYKGSEHVPTDEESAQIWRELGMPEDKIKQDGADVFWGPTGDSGPCGPTTEIYCKNASKEDVEIWNIVFNEYFCDGSRDKLDKGEATLKKMDTLGIDTGMGLERLVTIVQKKESVYDTDLFDGEKTKEERIVADHVKTAMFMVADGVLPGNSNKEYVLRRLIRRAKIKERYIYGEEFNSESSGSVFYEKIKNNFELYKNTPYFEAKKQDYVFNIISKEEINFRQTLEQGLKVFERKIKSKEVTEKYDSRYIGMLSSQNIFDLWTTYGFPIEVSIEEARMRGIKIEAGWKESVDQLMKEHQELSRTASAGMFKGGLANTNEKTVRLHTAHHLLLAALQEVLGKDVKQRGSNITEDRLRIDFTFDRKMTDEEKKKVEDIVNENINRGLHVVKREMLLAEAEKIGAEMEFGAKYPETVSVYFIEDENGNAISKEFCGGPHVSNTSELGVFKIKKEEASSQGVRRIKAVLE